MLVWFGVHMITLERGGVTNSTQRQPNIVCWALETLKWHMHAGADLLVRLLQSAAADKPPQSLLVLSLIHI